MAIATTDAPSEAGPHDRIALHEELRRRVRPALLPWCPGCQSHHVAPMLWRYATIAADARLDSRRRYTLAQLGARPPASEAVRRFLRFYGPARPADFAAWSGLARPHARRFWDAVAGELVDIALGTGTAWLAAEDVTALQSQLKSGAAARGSGAQRPQGR